MTPLTPQPAGPLQRGAAHARIPAGPVLLHSDGLPDARMAERLRAEGIALAPLSLMDAVEPDAAAVLLFRAADAPIVGHAPDHVAVVAADAEADRRAGGSERVLLVLTGEMEADLRAMRAAFRLSAGRVGAVRLQRELERTQSHLRDLSGIGMALMTERDPDRLLERIVSIARQLTASDAGSLYLTEDDSETVDRLDLLRFKLAQNHTIPDAPFVSFTLPIDYASLAGYAAATGETLRIHDAYEIPEDAPYGFNRSFDERFGYRTQSMLVVPMMDQLGTVVGVLQLINRKTDPEARITSEGAAEAYVVPYTDADLRMVQALAGQAAVSIENSLLYRQIEHLFESFVKAAVTAVDQRDPTTSGHSVRVATLTCDLAATLDGYEHGPHAGVRFTREQLRELRYAALLHDFGKVGVREEVLVKSRKLPPLLWERIQARFAFARRTLEAEHHRRRAELLERGERPALGLEAEYRTRIIEIDRVAELVRVANEPTVLPQAAAAELEDIARMTFPGPDGLALPYLTAEEVAYLRIPRGSLNDEERREIESHVEQTYEFLVQIPWTGDLRNVAAIAYGHHEKLNGRGYPRGLDARDIPVQTRIMTVSDIFDALTASDRPYKRALPVDRALDILHSEAREGLLDASLVELLVESRAYQRILETDWKAL